MRKPKLEKLIDTVREHATTTERDSLREKVARGGPAVIRLEIQEREVLARALFDLFRRQTCIYHSERDNGEAWAASADDRRLWHERAQEMADTVLAPIGWKPPSERARLREKVAALRADAERERIEAGSQELPINMHRQAGREDAFGEVLTLLDSLLDELTPAP